MCWVGGSLVNRPTRDALGHFLLCRLQFDTDTQILESASLNKAMTSTTDALKLLFSLEKHCCYPFHVIDYFRQKNKNPDENSAWSESQRSETIRASLKWSQTWAWNQSQPCFSPVTTRLLPIILDSRLFKQLGPQRSLSYKVHMSQ